MRLDIEYTDFDHLPYDQSLIELVVETTVAHSDYREVLDAKSVLLSVASLSLVEMQKANEKLRSKNVATDVISVGDYADDVDIVSHLSLHSEIDLGEILLCWDFVEESATMQGITAHHELCYVLSHGTLHLLGYDHSPRMYDIQEVVAQQLSLSDSHL